MASVKVLVDRLRQVLAAPSDDSPEAVADAITSYGVARACCDRLAPGTKSVSFEAYFTEVFGLGLDLKPPKEKKVRPGGKEGR